MTKATCAICDRAITEGNYDLCDPCWVREIELKNMLRDALESLQSTSAIAVSEDIEKELNEHVRFDMKVDHDASMLLERLFPEIKPDATWRDRVVGYIRQNLYLIRIRITDAIAIVRRLFR